MNKEKRNMVFIIDDEGDVLGLLTMDDILSVICGKGQDEYKHETEAKESKGEQDIKYISYGVFSVKPSVFLNELNDALSLSLHSANYDTLSGLILEKCQYLPKEKEEVLIDGVKFKIEKINGSKIEEVVLDING